jgi:hypothetical protein
MRLGKYPQHFFRFILLLSFVVHSACNDQPTTATGSSTVSFQNASSDNTIIPNNNGNNGNNNSGSNVNTVSPSGVNPYSLSMGYLLSCAKDLNSYQYCWGRGIGPVPTVMSWSSPLILTLKNSQIGGHSCYQYGVGSQLWCFGQNDYGQSGVNYSTQTQVNFPTLITHSGIATKVSAYATGYHHTCFVSSDITRLNRIYCLGDNTYGQLGQDNDSNNTDYYPYVQKSYLPKEYVEKQSVTNNGVTTIVDTPILSNNLIQDIVAGANHTCVIADGADSKVKCWGQGGRLGNNASSNSFLPQTVIANILGVNTPLTYVSNLSSGANHTCAIVKLAANGNPELYCWGKNSFGQVSAQGGKQPGNSSFVADLSDKNLAIHPTPICDPSDTLEQCWDTQPETLLKVNSISVGKNHSCAIFNEYHHTDGNLSYIRSNVLRCFGDNTYGQVMNPNSVLAATYCSSNKCSMTNKPLLFDVVSVSAGDNHTCAVQNIGTVNAPLYKTICWGKNDQGQSGEVQSVPIVTSPKEVIPPI